MMNSFSLDMLSASTLAYPLSNEGSGLFPVFLQTIFKNKLIAPALVSFSKDICVPDVAFKNRRPERKKLMGKSLESENQRSKEAWIVVSFLLDEPWLMKSKRN
ncbi:hypothetical protein HID58_043983 [Brassica napus]|uniref:Uncharacterized protein n=1 Tax=Brassica napus TaxID=3708 RepID=A0ABQ8BJR4_BRANA|nr:hypothetical protein HID58_043983 [Brassica napus]